MDLTLLGSNLTHNLMLEISNQIDELLLPYKVDLSLYNSLPADIKAHIRWTGKDFYRPGGTLWSTKNYNILSRH